MACSAEAGHVKRDHALDAITGRQLRNFVVRQHALHRIPATALSEQVIGQAYEIRDIGERTRNDGIAFS